MKAAARAVKKRRPARLIVAMPVAAPDIVAELRAMADDVVCLHEPAALFAVGLWYEDFRLVRDDEVVRVLERARRDGP